MSWAAPPACVDKNDNITSVIGFSIIIFISMHENIGQCIEMEQIHMDYILPLYKWATIYIYIHLGICSAAPWVWDIRSIAALLLLSCPL